MPLNENLIFSSFRKDIVSFNQDVEEGGALLFHNNNILRRAMREVKDIIFFCLFDNLIPGPGTPKMAMKGLISISCPNISEIILKYDFQ